VAGKKCVKSVISVISPFKYPRPCWRLCRNVRSKRSKRTKSGHAPGIGDCPVWRPVAPASFGVGFLSCQNCSIKRTHWAHPAYAVDSALRRRHPREAHIMRTNVIRNLMSLYYLLRLSRLAKQSHRGKTAPTFESYPHSSTVFSRQQEGKRIYLVTMADAFRTMVRWPGSPASRI
jgi:hypothetical protein